MLLGFFWKDWVRIVKGMGRSFRNREIGDDPDAKLGWLLVVATIPAGILGLLLQDTLRKLFASPLYASIFLALNGVMLFVAELLRRRAPETTDDDDARIAHTVGWRQTFTVGAAQALALVPGFSRSGAAIGGGLFVGLSHRDAARFAFLLATPIILAAAVLKLPELAGSQGDGVRGPALVGALCSGTHRVSRREVPHALLRDADADAVRDLLPLRGHGLRDLLRGLAAVLLREFAQASPKRRRELPRLESPLPVSRRGARPVHPRLAAEAEHVLRGDDGERRGRAVRDLDHLPRGRAPAEEARDRVRVVDARVDDLVADVVLRPVRAAR